MERVVDGVPEGSRPVARILVVSDADRVLMLRGTDGDDHWWVCPGGGLEGGESFAEAAARELLEETGLVLPLGPWIWTRRHRFEWKGRVHDQHERFFVAAGAPEVDPDPVRADSYISGHRWWSLAEICDSDDRFAPRMLGHLLPHVIAGRFPVDTGV